MTGPRFEILEREVVYAGFFKLLRYRLRHRLFEGGMGPELERELFERGRAAVVLPYDPERRQVVLVEQFRVGAIEDEEDPWLLEPVAGERFDLIVSNPPYVPCPDPELPARGPARAWDAGPDGRTVLDELIAAAPAHLNRGGALVLVHSTINGEERTLHALADHGLAPAVVARHPGPLGPLMSARVEHLEARGLLAPGRRDEEVLIVRGAAA